MGSRRPCHSSRVNGAVPRGLPRTPSRLKNPDLQDGAIPWRRFERRITQLCDVLTRAARIGPVLLVLGLVVGVAAGVGLLLGFEPARLPRELLNIAAYKLRFSRPAAFSPRARSRLGTNVDGARRTSSIPTAAVTWPRCQRGLLTPRRPRDDDRHEWRLLVPIATIAERGVRVSIARRASPRSIRCRSPIALGKR